MPYPHQGECSFNRIEQYYSSSKVSKALNQGCNYYEDYDQVGSDDYPHTYNNYEGFDFPVSGPYQEFPIKESGVYTGGKLHAVLDHSAGVGN